MKRKLIWIETWTGTPLHPLVLPLHPGSQQASHFEKPMRKFGAQACASFSSLSNEPAQNLTAHRSAGYLECKKSTYYRVSRHVFSFTSTDTFSRNPCGPRARSQCTRTCTVIVLHNKNVDGMFQVKFEPAALGAGLCGKTWCALLYLLSQRKPRQLLFNMSPKWPQGRFPF